jgi:hypothetical protein
VGAKLKKDWFDAVAKKDRTRLAALAKAGANLEWRNESGESALTLCVGSSDARWLRVLIDVGCSADAKNSGG